MAIPVVQKSRTLREILILKAQVMRLYRRIRALFVTRLDPIMLHSDEECNVYVCLHAHVCMWCSLCIEVW